MSTDTYDDKYELELEQVRLHEVATHVTRHLSVNLKGEFALIVQLFNKIHSRM